MLTSWLALSPAEREVFQVSVAYLRGKLRSRKSIEWALALNEQSSAERLAVVEVLTLDGSTLREPWSSVWRLLEESWRTSPGNRKDGGARMAIKRRIGQGERSGSLIGAIVDAVRPWLEIGPPRRTDEEARSAKASKTSDLILARLTSARPVKPYEIELWSIQDVRFLEELARALEAVLSSALDIAERLRSHGSGFQSVGWLRRVSFRRELLHDEPADIDRRSDPDDFHTGIAPAAKLLHAVVLRLSEVSSTKASLMMKGWETKSNVHSRLWSSLGQDPKLASAPEIIKFLIEVTDEQFWEVAYYPEIAELRSSRFRELDSADQLLVAARVRRGPGRGIGPRAPHSRAAWKRFLIVRELRRIEVAGGVLPEATRKWLEGAQKAYPELESMSSIEWGFPRGVEVYALEPAPDQQYDSLQGGARLLALEAALSSRVETGRQASHSQRAADWMRLPNRSSALMRDLVENLGVAGQCVQVWNRFGWTHSPANFDVHDYCHHVQVYEVAQVCRAIEQLPEVTITGALEGISDWLSSWSAVIGSLIEAPRIFAKVWPIAVAHVNEEARTHEQRVWGASVASGEGMDLEALNSSVGRLIEVFKQKVHWDYSRGERGAMTPGLHSMKSHVEQAFGVAGQMAQFRLLESFAWFTAVLPEWTSEYLVPLLKYDGDHARRLWIAAARGGLPQKTLRLVASETERRAVDDRLPRETRILLVQWLIFDSVRSLLEKEHPTVPYPTVQQVLRRSDDEVRAESAVVLKQFVAMAPSDRALRFNAAIRPFFERVWPQERSLITQGMASSLAELPAACGEAFAECVLLIVEYLRPFDCWSLYDFGIEEGPDRFTLDSISSPRDAEALLNLLDAAISSIEGAVVPYDLAAGLTRIEHVAPKLGVTPKFQRLRTLARKS